VGPRQFLGPHSRFAPFGRAPGPILCPGLVVLKKTRGGTGT
jgi:hypothetical protein